MKIPWQGASAPAHEVSPRSQPRAPRNVPQQRQPQPAAPRSVPQQRQPQQAAPRSAPQFGSNPPAPRKVPAQPSEQPGLNLPAFILRPVRLKAT